MRLVAWGLWLASVQVAQAATSGRFGHRSFRKRQAVEEPAAPKFEGLRLSYVTETTTEKVTETQVVVQTAQNDAVAAAETVTVTINPPAVTVTINAPVETVTINAPPITVTEVAAAPPPITVTETITSAVAQPFTVVEVSPITIVEVSPITVVDVVTQPVPQPPVTETITVAGEAPTKPPVTLIETVQAPADSVEDNKTAGPGVTTVPIAESALPTTTFSEDPLAQSRIEESSSAEETTSVQEPATSAQEPAASTQESTSLAQESTTSTKESTASSKASTTAAKESTSEVASVPDTSEAVSTTEAAPVATSVPAVPVMESNIVLGPSSSNDASAPAPAQPTGGSNSLNLGDLAPDATADAGTALPAVTAEPEAEEPRTRAPINISTLSLSSAINLGNLGGGGGAGLLKARATNAP
ncbi:uncharacterized protein NECHADRAFT_98571 [Fusarium vanettenii 77-13-4]|uniref:Uncharacterized protein n=1 Tax=Fusarium vanettenii (strain ATCC MYA-4622 / CBS 123669 / FGSC 9596 / NRRL 45880 / 77-13-4) TaxID=660122 RepID=C7YWC7_FUSV7|nr:uncharacterized protein NECHADRAFT_98571 [Fusarium vanettenii 77-13-4]EEU44156.1 hypothetical protein NECHADRAFT_98571 [Fusarium vanettenii 77-13-4]